MDASGQGNYGVVERHGQALNFTAPQLLLWAVDSTTLTVSDLAAKNISAFAIFSVDGGHTYETTMSDLMLGQDLIHPGGVIVVDDFVNDLWTGVVDGVIHHLHLNTTSLAPFLWACGKLYLAHKEWHDRYFQLVSRIPCVECSFAKQPFHVSRYSLAGWRMCVHVSTRFEQCSTDSYDTLFQQCLGLPMQPRQGIQK